MAEANLSSKAAVTVLQLRPVRSPLEKLALDDDSPNISESNKHAASRILSRPCRNCPVFFNSLRLGSAKWGRRSQLGESSNVHKSDVNNFQRKIGA
jgi:hypothetical protein